MVTQFLCIFQELMETHPESLLGQWKFKQSLQDHNKMEGKSHPSEEAVTGVVGISVYVEIKD